MQAVATLLPQCKLRTQMRGEVGEQQGSSHSPRVLPRSCVGRIMGPLSGEFRSCSRERLPRVQRTCTDLECELVILSQSFTPDFPFSPRHLRPAHVAKVRSAEQGLVIG